jgi:SAM-dependent methyltransferase
VASTPTRGRPPCSLEPVSASGIPESFFTLDPRWSSIEALIEAHTELRLDLGCGQVKPHGYVGLDNLVGVPPDQDQTAVSEEGLDPSTGEHCSCAGSSPARGCALHTGPDVLLDLNRERFPFPDDSCVEVRARHFLEHSVLDHIFAEAWRVLRPGGLFVIVVPYANSAWGMYPGHSIFLTERFFAESEPFANRFAIERTSYRPDESWEAWPRLVRRLIPYDWARTHLFNVCKEMRIEARAVKQSAA